MKSKRLGARLLAAASLVRDGAILADVGTDHAYLPIALLSEGKIARAVCSDINAGPLSSARDNAKDSGLFSRMEFYLTDGAVALSGLGVTDYAICGMGGELIASIIEAAPQLYDTGINLVLQPMTRHEALREFLWSHGFEILREVYPFEDGKQYVCMQARFVGGSIGYSPTEAYFGKAALVDKSAPGASDYIRVRKSAISAILNGKLSGGIDSGYERAVLDGLDKF